MKKNTRDKKQEEHISQSPILADNGRSKIRKRKIVQVGLYVSKAGGGKGRENVIRHFFW